MILPPLYCLLSLLTTIVTSSEISRPCIELSRELRLPCACALGPAEEALEGNPSVSMNCDGAVFSSDVPRLPEGAPIVAFTQRWAGHQSLPLQVFSSKDLPLRSVDLSGNSLRRLTEKTLRTFEATLVELRLADNRLGDGLNPIFSTTELRGLSRLRLLDLSGNDVKAIEEGLFDGCDDLQELHLERNSFTAVPSASLNGPKSLRLLSLADNRIESIKTEAFKSQRRLESIDLTGNLISIVESRAFSPLDKLKTIILAGNRLSRFNSDVFQGAENLLSIDLSRNFIGDFPHVALKAFRNLRYLNLSSNLIQSLENGQLSNLHGLHHLDLSRNNLANIAPGTFLGLKQLKRLDIGVNSLRTIEDDAFEGLDSLEFLGLKDNNILLIPASALGRLPKLHTVQLDYNRIAAISADILRSVASKLTALSLSKNIIRELPAGSFANFHRLETLDLSRNLLGSLDSGTFAGLDNNLLELDLSGNRISNLPADPPALSRLRRLDLSDNHLVDIPEGFFDLMPELRSFNASRNRHLNGVPESILRGKNRLELIDLSHAYAGVRSIRVESKTIKEIYLAHNNLQEIGEKAFNNMPNVTVIDLSYNNISRIKDGAFANVMNIERLVLKGNKLGSFKGEFFNTGTGLVELDLSNNRLTYLYPSSFRIHPRLESIRIDGNRLEAFPGELIGNLQYLRRVDLSRNRLKAIGELDFAMLPRLNRLNVAGNRLESINEMAFHNTTQLQSLDLGGNKLERLGERMFEGLVRLEWLNLENNRLADLPETIFERHRLQALENINLAGNSFEIAPLKALQKQYFFVDSVDLSHNKIRDIPAEDSMMVNIKKLDLSFNPLSEAAVMNILNEPKTVREINMAGTGIKNIPRLETPFLKRFNLSMNNIRDLNGENFERVALLEELDLSRNDLAGLGNFSEIWKLLGNLQTLDVSGNPIGSISNGDFDGLEKLRHLNLHNLTECTRIEKTAFKNLPDLSTMTAYGYPKLGYMDVQGILRNTPLLETVHIETKDPSIGKDQLQTLLHPRLKELGIRGRRLASISSGALSGIKGPELSLRFVETSLTSLPPALFFPVPRSTRVLLDVTGGRLGAVAPQLLAAIEDRRGDFEMIGLETNPIACDCGSRALRRWLAGRTVEVRCSAPEHLKGKLLVEIGDDELTCDARKTAPDAANATPRPQPSTPPTNGGGGKFKSRKITEPEIIWSMPPHTTDKPNYTSNNYKSKAKPGQTGAATPPTNDDTLVIGIVGGVVAFIAMLIIVICIVRLRMTGGGGGVATPAPQPGGCACSVKGGGSVYAVPPPYGAVYAATLPHKMGAHAQIAQMGRGPPPSNYSNYSTVERGGCGVAVQPYFIAGSYPSDEKIYR
ncbi:unnamed protein product [Phyllotreta striolata]|uniref:LRRCT domain-containing protein n=1 Tax=Phyllotreta striolata TaxID=444603 RepID=A0A9N9XKF1_PHYSR|nr:unnamed protein product [Phyllotreta striolata]